MYILSIDQGTSSTRAMIYSLQGKLIAMSQNRLAQSYPKPGWVEQDPEDIWQTTLTSIREVIANINVQHIIACGMSNQRETTLIWDKATGQCLAPAIVWQDRRTQDFCQSLTSYTQMIHAKTGLRADAYFSASKLHWLFEQIPHASTLAKQNRLAFGTVDSFLLWRLTGGKTHATDVTNASRTLLFNIMTQTWDAELLQLFDLPDTILPEVRSSDAYFGAFDPAWLGVAIPIWGIAGDQQAAFIGQCCFEPGMVKATFGTGGFVMLNTGSTPVLSRHHLLTTIAYRIQNQTIYGLEGAIYDTGTTLKWLRDSLQLFDDISESENLARSLTSNDGVYLVPSFAGLGAPHWFTQSGAAMIGLVRNTTRAHFVRAALECVAYQTEDILIAMRADINFQLALLRVDGGMAVNAWLLQFLASLTGMTIQRPHHVELTALGAAMLAAIGCGAVDSFSTLTNQWELTHQWKPEPKRDVMERNYQGWLKAVQSVTMGQ